MQTFKGLEKGQAEERSINCNPLMYSVFKSFYNKINTVIQLHIVVEGRKHRTSMAIGDDTLNYNLFTD